MTPTVGQSQVGTRRLVDIRPSTFAHGRYQRIKNIMKTSPRLFTLDYVRTETVEFLCFRSSRRVLEVSIVLVNGPLIHYTSVCQPKKSDLDCRRRIVCDPPIFLFAQAKKNGIYGAFCARMLENNWNHRTGQTQICVDEKTTSICFLDERCRSSCMRGSGVYPHGRKKLKF